MTATKRGAVLLRATQVAAVLLLCGYVLQALVPGLARHVGGFSEAWLYPALSAVGGAFCLARGLLHRRERGAWIVLGAGILASAGGDVWWQRAGYDSLASVPAFTPADALWLAFYPASLAGVWLLVRARVRRLHRGLALDALIGALGMTAVGVALVWGGLADGGVTHLGGDFPTDLANFLGDLVLIGVTVAAFAVTGWRPGRALGLLGAGLIVAAGADGFFLWQGATGSEVGSTAITALTPGSLMLVGLAAWQPAVPVKAAEGEGWRPVAFTAGFASAALTVIVEQAFAGTAGLATCLAAATLAAVIVRMAVALADHMRLLAASRQEALTDALTGLGNRRRLMADLETRVYAATLAEPCAVLLFDLDGFKQYNDWHGHPAGDALLTRLGARLATGTGASAYRMGGDEFCIIAAGGEPERRRVLAAAIEALSDAGGGFEVSTSCGSVMVPQEAATPAAALRTADERLYEQKARRHRAGTPHQATARARSRVGRQPNVNA